MDNLVLEPETLPREERRIIPADRTLVATALSKESKIDLYTLQYQKSHNSTVFIYPASFQLTKQVIENMDDFSDIEELAISREFKELSTEELDELFKNSIKPLYSLMDYYHKVHNTPIIGHSYSLDSLIFLHKVITDLR